MGKDEYVRTFWREATEQGILVLHVWGSETAWMWG